MRFAFWGRVMAGLVVARLPPELGVDEGLHEVLHQSKARAALQRLAPLQPRRHGPAMRSMAAHPTPS